VSGCEPGDKAAPVFCGFGIRLPRLARTVAHGVRMNPVSLGQTPEAGVRVESCSSETNQAIAFGSVGERNVMDADSFKPEDTTVADAGEDVRGSVVSFRPCPVCERKRAGNNASVSRPWSRSAGPAAAPRRRDRG